ncbi:MAG: hypothetical protein LBC83_03455 [Oscillospiraceae bacterium]|jgi:Mrp family chromosome partitioning ATPase|nr:hypothetical protein [Oscillospiraceae bacterium]
MQDKRITIFAGHYGSGKTTLAVNYALSLAQRTNRVVLCDLDIVNPYFRTADHAALLQAGGVELISSPYANSNVEMPWIPTAAQRILDDSALCAVLDLGGDDSGAMALGRYAPQLRQNEVEFMLVVNLCRPLTRDAASLRVTRSAIESAAKLRFTGIVNSTNLGEATAADTVLQSLPTVRALAKALGLPVALTVVRRELAQSVQLSPADGALFPVTCFQQGKWAI